MSGRLLAAVIAVLFVAFIGEAIAKPPKTYTSPADAKPRSEMEIQRELQKPDYARGGFYIGVEGLYALEQSPTIEGTTDSGGVNIRLGHRHNRWLATELYGIYVHRFGGYLNNWYGWGLSANENLYLTKGRVQPYLSVGVGFLQLRLGSDQRFIRFPGGGSAPIWAWDGVGLTPGFAARFGGGFLIHINESVAITLVGAYHLTTGGLSGHDFITAGAGLQFF
jgi:hypothetical protein